MNIYVLRHGLAGERGDPNYPNDAERPLTEEGRRKLWKIAKAMKALDLSFDLLLSSPYVRTRQTADIIAEAFELQKKLKFSKTLEPEGNQKELIQFLNRLKPARINILLVGHEPYLSTLISLLVSGDSNLSIVIKKGGLCKLGVESLKHGRCATLQWLLTPKQFVVLERGGERSPRGVPWMEREEER